MNKIKLLKNVLIFSSIFSFLTSCSKGHIRYGVASPYLEVEKNEEGILKDVLPSYINDKINNKDNFVLFLHRTHCSYCNDTINNFLTPFLQENPIVIYGLNGDEFELNENEYSLYQEIIKPLGNIYQGYRVVPYFAIFEEGQFIQGELDSEFFELLITTYVKL